MRIEHNADLRLYNTFGLQATARYLAHATSIDVMKEILADATLGSANRLVLGGGSNILLTKNFDGLVLRNAIRGIELVEETVEHFFVRAGGGENWHQFVLHCIAKGWAGIENLSLIPGCVGASPMQNIGAYGVEIKDVFHSLEALHIPTGEMHTFHGEDCAFGYRESVFKRKLKDQYIITSVMLRLDKTPAFKVSYGAIQQQLEVMNVQDLNIRAVSDAVIAIRKSKLPDPAEIGNSGSFFKNPVVDQELYDRIKDKFPELVAYPAQNGMKLAAGWLIEQAGWKGKTFDNYGVHKKQALVLVNYGGADGSAILALSTEIMESIYEKFGVQLEREVNII